MAEEGKGVAMAILGIVAVIAVVGLVLLFKGAGTGEYASPYQNIYGGAIKDVDFPYLEGRWEGHPSSKGGDQLLASTRNLPEMHFARGVRQIPSKSCETLASTGVIPSGYTKEAGAQQAWDYQSIGYECIDATEEIAAYCCTEGTSGPQ